MAIKTLRRLLIVGFCSIAILSASSVRGDKEDGKFTVTTVDELTNTLTRIATRGSETVVTIAAGVYDLSQIEKMHSKACLSISNAYWKGLVTLQGDPEKSREEIVLDAKGVARVLRIWGKSASVTTIKNLTIKNALTTGSHGGVVTEDYGDVVFENCVFDGNQAELYGAAVGGSANEYFVDCLFIGNTLGGGYGGGGVIDTPNGVSGCRFFGNGIYGDQIKGGCVRASCMITNCIFDSNCNTGKWGEAVAVYLMGSGSCVDCTFTNNYWGASTTKGGALVLTENASAIECRFYDNVKSSAAGGAISYISGGVLPGKIESCVFIGNKTTGTANGGAVANFPGLITNCTFIGNSGSNGGAVYACSNIVDCVFACNITRSQTALQNGGAGYKSVFYDCVVTNNIGQEMSGSFSSCSVYRSKVGGAIVNNKQNERTVEADNTYFEDCELFGLWKFGVGYSDCGFNRCVIRDNPFSEGYGYLIAGKIAVTNSLLLRNTAYRMFHDYKNGFDNSIVNCSFVSNRYDIFAHAFENSTLRVVNNLFVDTKTRAWNTDDDLGQVFSGSVFSNNYISTAQPYVGYGNINARPASAPKPMLMMERDEEHPFAPKRLSILNGAGLVEDWMTDASDLAGNARLTDDKVAIGAYETTARPRINSILVR